METQIIMNELDTYINNTIIESIAELTNIATETIKLNESIDNIKKERELEINRHICYFVPIQPICGSYEYICNSYEYICSDVNCPYIRSPSIYSEGFDDILTPESVESVCIDEEH
jgi:hypothetical protein